MDDAGVDGHPRSRDGLEEQFVAGDFDQHEARWSWSK